MTEELLREFDAKVDVEEIAAKHQRTVGAIWSRLEKLGRTQRKDFPESTPLPLRTGASLDPPSGDKNEEYLFSWLDVSSANTHARG